MVLAGGNYNFHKEFNPPHWHVEYMGGGIIKTFADAVLNQAGEIINKEVNKAVNDLGANNLPPLNIPSLGNIPSSAPQPSPTGIPTPGSPSNNPFAVPGKP